MKFTKTKGFLSVEAVIVLFVVVSGLSLGLTWIERDADSKLNQATAEHAKAFMDGAASYVKANYSTVQAAANPLVTYSAANIAPHLGSNFTQANPYGQTFQLRVYKTAANKLESMIVATGGEVINEKSLREISQLMGASGGFVSGLDTARAQGAFGGWNMSFTNYGTSPGGGKVAGALFFEDGQQVADYLYRNAVPGRPELNQMNTALDMTAKNIENVGKLSGKQANLSVDGAVPCCSPAGVTPTLNLSEATNATGRKPTIQFHSSGYHEGYIELSTTGEPRRFNLRDNQGVGIGLSATGDISSPSVTTTTANVNGTIQMKNGQGIYTAGRQHVDATEHLYLQPFSGGNTYVGGGGGSGRLVTMGDSHTNGTSYQHGRTVNYAPTDVYSNDWAMIARNAAGQDNAQAQNPTGSAYVNDVFIRSVGKWASQIGGGFTNYFVVTGADFGRLGQGVAYCPAGSRVISGGYALVQFNGGMNAPDNSYPDPGINAWRVGGSGSSNIWRPFAMCAS